MKLFSRNLQNCYTVVVIFQNGLLRKLEETKLDLNWIERLDIVTQPAPMAPEMFHEVSQT